VQPAVVSIHWTSEEAELREALALREEVFCRGRVAVERALRRRSVASRMLELAIAAARKQGFDRVLLTAQTRATAVWSAPASRLNPSPSWRPGSSTC
jgi:GNAT superfamily N-acetyltransferase